MALWSVMEVSAHPTSFDTVPNFSVQLSSVSRSCLSGAICTSAFGQFDGTQVAAVAAGALQQSSGNVILEAWADPAAPYTPVDDLLESVRPPYPRWLSCGHASAASSQDRDCCVHVARTTSCADEC